MVRRRRKGRKSSELVKFIFLSTILLSYAYTKDIKAALELSLPLIILGTILWLIIISIFSDLTSSTKSSRRVSGRKSQLTAVPVTQKPAEWSIALIKKLEWKRFEELCAGYYQAKGIKAYVTEQGADGGIDVLLYEMHDPDKIAGVVQCKSWTNKPVGVKEIRELFGIMTDVGCSLGVYVTTTKYTSAASSFAEGKDIKLIDTQQLLGLINELPLESRKHLLQKMTSGDYTTPSCPSCGIKLLSKTSLKGKYSGESFWACSNYPRCRYTMQNPKLRN